MSSARLPQYLTPDQIAKSLQLSRRTIMKEIRAGRLVAAWCANRARISPDALREWLERAEGRKS